MDELLEALEGLARRVQAQQYWLAQLYMLVSRDRPGLMAQMIDHKIESLKNEPPRGPADMTPAQLEAVMLQELPSILLVGAELAENLRGTQRTMDEMRAANTP